MQSRGSSGRYRGLANAGIVALGLGAAVLAWLWPIGLGGKMPIGGDVTQFFLGLMAVLQESQRLGRLAVWNDLWGYGFPGLAESQMGVYYPPHVILYRVLSLESAYVASLVIHTVWGALGAFWAARTLGISRAGSALASISWSTCGFFLIHLAHPWGYTTGCWMPWAWGLAGAILDPSPGRKVSPGRPLLLSLVLVLQVLPGHFQLAFLTQVGVVLMIVWAFAERGLRIVSRSAPRDPTATTRIGKQALAVGLALAAVIPLAALQLWPTARLARLAAGQRDFDYLSGFASTPFHMVNYVAPGLFHRSPLWRPLVWDPFHTSPEEHLSYVGLVPFLLAAMTILREWRRDRTVRLMTFLAAATLFLSLGPYLPGFRLLISVPGFSFFRAPSRWSVATALALAMLAGKGFDRWQEWSRPGRSLFWYAVGGAGWILASLLVIELAISSTAAPGWPDVARWFERAFEARPWSGDPPFRSVMAQARQVPGDPRLPAGLPQTVLLKGTELANRFTGQRGAIYVRELWESAAIFLSVIVIAALCDRGRLTAGRARGALFLVTCVDLWILGRHRLIDVAPIRSLVEESPVLARLSREPRGTRIADDGLRNLPMRVGLSPIAAYRTLNLPAVESLTALARGPLNDPRYEHLVKGALRATGTSLRLLDPLRNRAERLLGRALSVQEAIDDRALARWMLDSAWGNAEGDWPHRFTLWRSDRPPFRAWLLPASAGARRSALDEWSGDPAEILSIFEQARPLATECREPEFWRISVDDGEFASVVISQLADPQWHARWVGLDGQRPVSSDILPTFRKRNGTGLEPGGWQRVKVPGAGRWTLELVYDARDVAEGMAISIIAWISWISLAVATARRAYALRWAATIHRDGA